MHPILPVGVMSLVYKGPCRKDFFPFVRDISIKGVLGYRAFWGLPFQWDSGVLTLTTYGTLSFLRHREGYRRCKPGL